MNSNYLNSSSNFIQNRYYHHKKISFINSYIISGTINNTSENRQSKDCSLRISLPIQVIKPKIVSSRLCINTIELNQSPSSRIKKGQFINFNNNSIYYSKHKNKTTLINSYLNSDIKFNTENDKLNNTKNENKFSSSLNNFHLNSENKENKINNKYPNRNQQSIRKLLNFKNNNFSSKISYNNYLKKNIFENSKNNYSIEKNKKHHHILPVNKLSNLSINNISLKKINNNNINKNKNNNLLKNISQRKLLLPNKNPEKICVQKSSKLKTKSRNNNINNNRVLKEIPQIIKPKEFKIIRNIGSGSFGSIFITRWIKNNEKYAMKIMHTKSKDSILYIKDKVNMIMEFEQKSNCDGLIKIFGDAYILKGEKDYYYYEVMELAERDWEQEIKNRYKNKNYYTECELFTIMSQLVKTFSLLQKNHITHRDIKLQNILLINNKYKICDFGEARKLEQKGVIVQPARGSELYMSPIQFFGLNQKLSQVKHNTYKSDVFSLGMCILFAATLNDDCLYDIREITDMNIIKNILERYLSKRYSSGFIRLLLCFLEINEKLRPDFIQLDNIISHIKIND